MVTTGRGDRSTVMFYLPTRESWAVNVRSVLHRTALGMCVVVGGINVGVLLSDWGGWELGIPGWTAAFGSVFVAVFAAYTLGRHSAGPPDGFLRHVMIVTSVQHGLLKDHGLLDEVRERVERLDNDMTAVEETVGVVGEETASEEVRDLIRHAAREDGES